MKTKLALWVLVLIVVALLVGCGGSGDDTDPFTVDNLQGTYDLDVSASMLDGVIDDDAELVSGTLEVGGMIATFAITVLQARTFAISGADTLTVTDADGDMNDIRATFTDNGATLTILTSLDADADTLVLNRRDGTGSGNDLTQENLQGTYDMDVAGSSSFDIGDDDFVATSAVLDVVDTTITFTPTGTNTVTYTVTNRSQITVTEDDGDVMVLTGSLTNDATRLRLVEEDGDVLIFNRR